MPADVVEDKGLEALQRELASSRAENEQLKKKPAAAAPVPQSKEAVEQMFWKDPLPMVQAIAQQAARETEQRIQANTGDTQRAIARKEVRSSDPETFDQYEVEIEAAASTVAPQYQGNINVWKNAFDIVKGQHINEILEKKKVVKAAEGEPPVTAPKGGDGPGLPSPKAPPAAKVEALSSDEKEVAKGLKMSEDNYRRGKHRLANQDAEWAKVVTFNSEDKPRAAAAK